MKRFNNIKWFTLGIVTCLLISSVSIPAFATSLSKTANLVYNDIKITLNGSPVTPLDANGNVVEPFTIDGTTYLPVRAIANALGVVASWNGDTKTVSLSNDGLWGYPIAYYPGTPVPTLGAAWGGMNCDYAYVDNEHNQHWYYYKHDKLPAGTQMWDAYDSILKSKGFVNLGVQNYSGGSTYIEYLNNDTKWEVDITEQTYENCDCEEIILTDTSLTIGVAGQRGATINLDVKGNYENGDSHYDTHIMTINVNAESGAGYINGLEVVMPATEDCYYVPSLITAWTLPDGEPIVGCTFEQSGKNYIWKIPAYIQYGKEITIGIALKSTGQYNLPVGNLPLITVYTLDESQKICDLQV